MVTYALRLLRDLREHRKAPHVLVRRGWRLMRAEPEIVARMAELGCEPMPPRRAEQRLRDLIGT
jgi:uridine kinase